MQKAIEQFTKECQQHAAFVPFTMEEVLANPKGRRPNTDSWIAAYSVYERNGKKYLAGFVGSRFSNGFYYEFDEDGNELRSWSEWGSLATPKGEKEWREWLKETGL